MSNTANILREVAAAVRAPDLERAADLAEAALDQGVVHALLLNLRAWRFERQGRDAEALACLSQARALSPLDVPTLNALGLCLARLNRMPEAIEAFEAAVAADPGFAPALFNLGWTSEQLGDLAQAKASFERALALTPQAGGPLGRLAFLAARAGDWDGARSLAQRALEVESAQPTATLALAWAELGGGALTEAEGRLRGLLAQPSVTPADRALAHGLLGDVLDAGERPADAFRQFDAANAVLRDAYASRFARPGQETVAEQLRWLLRHVEAQAAHPRAANPPPASGAAGHVFVVGFPRSGTTLLERVLSAHPGVAAWDERENLVDSVRAYLSSPAALERLDTASEAELAPFRADYWRRVAAGGAEVSSKVALDKLPLNSMKLPLIARLFPQAKIILAVRDPRDVVLSCFRQRFQMNASMYELLTLAGAARLYDGVMRLAARSVERLDLDVHTHRYEDLVANFDAEAQAVCRFIGLPWRESMRDFAATLGERASATPSAAQVAQGLYSQGVGQWRRFREELAPIMPILAPWVARFGYSAEQDGAQGVGVEAVGGREAR